MSVVVRLPFASAIRRAAAVPASAALPMLAAAAGPTVAS